MINMEDLMGYETMRMEAYRLFADGYRPPDAGIGDVVEGLRRQLSGLGSDASGPVAEIMMTGGSETPGLEALKADFARLFVGPYTLLAAPYGSIYLEEGRTLMGDSTLDARDFYRDAGVDMDPAFMDAPDHIAVELEFLHLLVFREVEAMRRGNVNEAAQRVQEQAAFLARHLGLWVAPFSKSVENAAETSFYRSLAEATRIFVLEDHNRIGRAHSVPPAAFQEIEPMEGPARAAPPRRPAA